MRINIKKIENKAEQLLFASDIQELPVDLEKIAIHLNLRIRHDELDDDVSGILLVEKNKPVVIVNKQHHINRQRFTIAHELGHYILHVKEREALFIDRGFSVHHRDANSSLGTLKHEREANLFASILLMPESRVREVVEKNNLDFFDETSMFFMSKKFGVSQQAIGFRLARLDYEVGQG